MSERSETKCAVLDGPPVSELLSHISQAELRSKILGATLVVLPELKDADVQSAAPYFLPGSHDAFQFLAEQTPSGLTVEIACDDQDYRELALHSAELWVPTLLILTQQPHALAVSLNVISNYIYDRMRGLLHPDVCVHSKIHIDAEARTVSITYTGPAQTYESVMKQALGKAFGRAPKNS